MENKKSEDTLIQVAKASKRKQKYLKRVIVVLLIITVASVISLGVVVFYNLLQPKNYITAVERNSAEMKTAELLSGADGAFMLRYFTGDEFKTLTVFMSEYHFGKLIEKNKVADLAYEDIESTSEGMIVLIPDFEQFTAKLIVTDKYAKYSIDFPILEDVENRAYYGRSSAQIEEEISIKYYEEQRLLSVKKDNNVNSRCYESGSQSSGWHCQRNENC